MRSQQPSFQQRGHPMNPRQQFGRSRGIQASQHGHLMNAAEDRQSRVAVPSIGMDLSAWHHRRLDKSLERRGGEHQPRAPCESAPYPCRLLRRRSTTNALWSAPRPRLPSAKPPCKFHPLPPCPTRHPAPGEPSRGATCATNSRRSGNRPTPKHVASPRHWLRASGWSMTKPPGTTVAEACACPGKWSQAVAETG